jgi:acyl carrier protein
MSIEDELRTILGKWNKNNEVALVPTMKLEDLNIDSLDLVEVMFEIEEKFDVSLMQGNQEAKSATLSDLCGWIEHQISLKEKPATLVKPAGKKSDLPPPSMPKRAKRASQSQ